MDDITLDDIVGDREQRADEDSIAFGAFGNPGIAIGGGGKALGVEAAFRAGRHDHRVLGALCLHQPQDLGAEIVAPVGPAKPARSEEHTSELQSLMRISYAVFCLKKKNHSHQLHTST